MKELTLEQVAEQFKGKGGSPEAESILNDNNGDKKEGFITFWSNKADAAKVIERCKNSILEFSMVGDGVQLVIDRKAFRGAHCAFRKVGGRKPREKKNG